MSLEQEVQLLRKELRFLRQRTAQVENAWQQQKDSNEKLKQDNYELKCRIKDLEDKNKKLQDENTNIAEQLDATISHKNTLAGMIFKSNKKKSGNESGRKRGGQKGHKGHGRKKPKKVDQEKEVHLSHCPDCGTEVEQTSTFYQRTVEDMPPPRPNVTLYHIQRQWCGCCQKEVHGVPAETLEGFRVGLNLIILILFQKYKLRVPLQKISESLKEQYDIDLTAGGIQDILHRLKKRFGDKYQAIIEEIRQSKVKHADETGWRVEGINSWCWLFATQKAAYYTITETRGKGVPQKVLGKKPQGVLVRDDYRSYQKLPMEQQSCWTHLLRTSHEAAEKDKASNEIVDLHQELKKMFDELNIVRKLSKKKRQQAYTKHLKQLQDIQARQYKHKDSQAVQTRIKNQNERLLTVLKYKNVPLTNNHAERQIRPMVVTRKISGGSRSQKGAATHAVNMSVAQTISLEKKPFFAGVKELLLATVPKFALENAE